MPMAKFGGNEGRGVDGCAGVWVSAIAEAMTVVTADSKSNAHTTRRETRAKQRYCIEAHVAQHIHPRKQSAMHVYPCEQR
eukprot:14770003-Alexandrium_andersonii.AAC.1